MTDQGKIPGRNRICKERICKGSVFQVRFRQGNRKTKDICNVRKTASTDGELLGKVDAGVKLKKLGTKGEWTKVKFQGKTGYIKSDLLKTVK